MDIIVMVILWAGLMVLAPLALFWAYRRASRRRPGRLRVSGLVIVTYLIGIEAVGAGFLISNAADAGWIAVPHTVLSQVRWLTLIVGMVGLVGSGALWFNGLRGED